MGLRRMVSRTELLPRPASPSALIRGHVAPGEAWNIRTAVSSLLWIIVDDSYCVSSGCTAQCQSAQVSFLRQEFRLRGEHGDPDSALCLPVKKSVLGLWGQLFRGFPFYWDNVFQSCPNQETQPSKRLATRPPGHMVSLRFVNERRLEKSACGQDIWPPLWSLEKDSPVMTSCLLQSQSCVCQETPLLSGTCRVKSHFPSQSSSFLWMPTRCSIWGHSSLVSTLECFSSPLMTSYGCKALAPTFACWF